MTTIDPKTGKFETRQALSAPVGMGYEYLQTNPKDKVTGITTRYNKGYDMLEDVISAAKQTKEKLAAKSVEAGKYDLVLDPSHLWLTIHESVGHPLELDRCWVMRPILQEPVLLPWINGRAKTLIMGAKK